MGDFPNRQEAIRIASTAIAFALCLGLSIARAGAAGYAIAAMQLVIGWVMIPEPERGLLWFLSKSEHGRTMAPVNPQHQDEDHVP